jgi:hypothetical protein
MKKILSLGIIALIVYSTFSICVFWGEATIVVISEFDTFPGVLPYSDPNDNLYIGWTLDITSAGASEGRDVVTNKIGASITGAVDVSIAGTYLVSVWVLDRGTTDKIEIDGREWTFVAPATGTYEHEEFKKVQLGEIYLSAGSHSVTLTHIAPGTAGSYPQNSILDYLHLECMHAPVGGEATPIYIPINNPEMPTLLIWLTTIILSFVVTVVYVKRRKRNTEISS